MTERKWRLQASRIEWHVLYLSASLGKPEYVSSDFDDGRREKKKKKIPRQLPPPIDIERACITNPPGVSVSRYSANILGSCSSVLHSGGAYSLRRPFACESLVSRPRPRLINRHQRECLPSRTTSPSYVYIIAGDLRVI